MFCVTEAAKIGNYPNMDFLPPKLENFYVSQGQTRKLA